MKRLRFATAMAVMSAFVVSATALLAPAAYGAPADNGDTDVRIDDDAGSIEVEIEIRAPGTTRPGVGRVPRPFYWRYERINIENKGGIGPAGAAVFIEAGGVEAPPRPPVVSEEAERLGIPCGTYRNGVVLYGFVNLARQYRRSTNEIVATRYVCVPVNAPAVPPGGEAPTFAEIWRAIPIPRPSVNFSPKVTGLTGMETWFWNTQNSEIQIAASLDGWTAVGTARLTALEWRMGDGAIRRVDGTFERPVPPSSEQAHALAYTYETKGNYTVAVIAEWEGRATVTSPGGITTAENLGTARLAPVTRPYTVLEAIASLVATPPTRRP